MRAIKSCFVQGDVETNNVFLTSGFQPPTNVDMLDRVNVSAYMQSYASGGSIEHIFLGGKVSNNLKKSIIKKIFDTPVTYMTLSPIVSVCNSCHNKFVGEYYECPECHDTANMMIYARVIGYVRPIVCGHIKIDETGAISGDENYWQDTRRKDWVMREKYTG